MNKEKFTAVEKANSADGTKFAVVHAINMYGQDVGYEVWAFKTNYREGSRWVTCKKEMTITDAKAYFQKRISS